MDECILSKSLPSLIGNTKIENNTRIRTDFSTEWSKSIWYLQELELERLRSEDTPHRFLPLMITHIIESYWIPSQKTKSKLQIWRNKLYMRHTFWSCFIRCANMQLIRQVLLKIQSGHDSVHRRTDRRTDGQMDGQTDKVKPVYPPLYFVEAGGKISNIT